MVKFISLLAVALSVSMFFSSCTGGLEQRGNSAYNKAKHSSGYEQRQNQKLAYTFYLKAVQRYADKQRIPRNLRNRYIETTLTRGNMILDEATADMDALAIFEKDLDAVINQDVLPDLKQRYAEFIVRMADSISVKGKLMPVLDAYDKAIVLAPNPSGFAEKKAAIVKQYVTTNWEMAQSQYEEGTINKDPKALIRAEYYSKITLVFDAAHAEARAMLDKLNKENRNAYSAYAAVIDQKPDTTIWDKVNLYDILICVPQMSVSGGVTIKANMYNYSYNPLRMWDTCFAIVDVNGQKYKALASSTLEPEILDQQHETTKLILHFPNPAADVKKLTYTFNEHYTEKILN